MAKEGERKTVPGSKIYEDSDKTYFVYQLVTPLKGSYGMSAFGTYEIPRLPTSANVSWGINSLWALLIHNFNLPAMITEISKQKDYLDKQLADARRDSGIVQSSSGASMLGIDPWDMETILYVPASTIEEADQRVRNYSNKVSNVLGSCNLKCGYKIRPIVEKH